MEQSAHCEQQNETNAVDKRRFVLGMCLGVIS
jgi:hypothetical protein